MPEDQAFVAALVADVSHWLKVGLQAFQAPKLTETSSCASGEDGLRPIPVAMEQRELFKPVRKHPHEA